MVVVVVVVVVVGWRVVVAAAAAAVAAVAAVRGERLQLEEAMAVLELQWHHEWRCFW